MNDTTYDHDDDGDASCRVCLQMQCPIGVESVPARALQTRRDELINFPCPSECRGLVHEACLRSWWAERGEPVCLVCSGALQACTHFSLNRARLAKTYTWMSNTIMDLVALPVYEASSGTGMGCTPAVAALWWCFAVLVHPVILGFSTTTLPNILIRTFDWYANSPISAEAKSFCESMLKTVEVIFETPQPANIMLFIFVERASRYCLARCADPSWWWWHVPVFVRFWALHTAIVSACCVVLALFRNAILFYWLLASATREPKVDVLAFRRRPS